MNKGFKNLFVLAAGLLILPAIGYGQSYTVNFTATPPVIDGKISAGEWDAAAPAIDKFSAHDSETPEDTSEPTKVRVLYSVDALYILYECTDTLVQSVVTGSELKGSYPADYPGRQGSGDVGWTFANTDYLAVYFDPANVADDRTDVDPSFFSYSIQAEPSITANNAAETYIYTEAGRWGGAQYRVPNPQAIDGVTTYWVGGQGWDLANGKIVDGKTANGYVMEWRLPWSDFDSPYYQAVASSIVDNSVILSGADASILTDPTTMFGLEGIAGAKLTGMPIPGTIWKVNFCRHSASSPVQYVNWVGATGGFVSRPFGQIVFGTAPASAVQNALLHQ